jgi:hypothetical protein
MKIGPHYPAVNAFGGFEEVMMVVPVNAEINETENVTEEDGQERTEHGKVGAV